MKRIKILLVVLGLISGFAFGQINNFKPGSDPDGFRGIKWGTDIRTLCGMKYFRTDESYGGIEVYIRENDELKIGDATLERIEYVFWRGKFCAVGIYTKGFVRNLLIFWISNPTTSPFLLYSIRMFPSTSSESTASPSFKRRYSISTSSSYHIFILLLSIFFPPFFSTLF